MTEAVNHASACHEALQLYVADLATPRAADDWRAAHVQSRKQIVAALKASKFFTDISAALQVSGAHLAVIRHLLAPPMSQDQFSLLCPEYPKRAEKTGRPLSKEAADAVASAFLAVRDKRLTRWLDTGKPPTRTQIINVLRSVVPMLSQQIVATLSRTRLSSEQEAAVVGLLAAKGWQRKTSGLIETLSDVPSNAYMHKARFATKTRPQEVDIACGLGKTVVLAMECKVTNDVTNSVKRINDILKKATAWQDHWGSFVRTAALLQGVIALKDVERLLEANVIVFWSHDLSAFGTWLDDNANAN